MSVAEGDVALALHWCLAPPIRPMVELGPDGHPARGGYLPPVPLPRRMWAGGEVETLGPWRIGDRVVRRSRIGDVTAKAGRSGALCFVAVHHDYETSRGLAVRERHDIVYRDASGGAPAARAEPPPPAPRDAEWQVETWQVETSPTLLFRYSAMTFNGHRIHYDLPYATGEEGYDGLVVHGPIQATLLLNLAGTLLGAPPARFRYRGLAPLTAGRPLRVAARQEVAAGQEVAARHEDGQVRAWTERHDGTVCMEAWAATA